MQQHMVIVDLQHYVPRLACKPMPHVRSASAHAIEHVPHILPVSLVHAPCNCTRAPSLVHDITLQYSTMDRQRQYHGSAGARTASGQCDVGEADVRGTEDGVGYSSEREREKERRERARAVPIPPSALGAWPAWAAAAASPWRFSARLGLPAWGCQPAEVSPHPPRTLAAVCGPTGPLLQRGGENGEADGSERPGRKHWPQ